MRINKLTLYFLYFKEILRLPKITTAQQGTAGTQGGQASILRGLAAYHLVVGKATEIRPHYLVYLVTICIITFFYYFHHFIIIIEKQKNVQ